MQPLQRKLRGVSTSAIIALMLVAAPLSAQNPKTQLTLGGGTITFPAPTATDYINGYVNSTTGVTYTVNATNGAVSHTTTILIRSTSANLGNGKALVDLEWRRSDLAAWNAISQTDAQVEQKVVILNLLNDPWSNTIFFRMKLSWTADAPAVYSANYQITLSQTVP
ncbi:MAG TPA: hypothetical protein VJS39_09590 [Gemmatimonadaceae bacterium]|nr:hypothetical protein [Gemmatimonadaceae bacterium]